MKIYTTPSKTSFHLPTARQRGSHAWHALARPWQLHLHRRATQHLRRRHPRPRRPQRMLQSHDVLHPTEWGRNIARGLHQLDGDQRRRARSHECNNHQTMWGVLGAAINALLGYMEVNGFDRRISISTMERIRLVWAWCISLAVEAWRRLETRIACSM